MWHCLHCRLRSVPFAFIRFLSAFGWEAVVCGVAILIIIVALVVFLLLLIICWLLKLVIHYHVVSNMPLASNELKKHNPSGYRSDSTTTTTTKTKYRFTRSVMYAQDLHINASRILSFRQFIKTRLIVFESPVDFDPNLNIITDSSLCDMRCIFFFVLFL